MFDLLLYVVLILWFVAFCVMGGTLLGVILRRAFPDDED